MSSTIQDLFDRGFSELTPDCFDEIMEKLSDTSGQTAVQAEELNRSSAFERVQVKHRRVAASFAAAAVAVLCLFSLNWYDAVKVTDEIFIDVNPSVVLELNSKGDLVRTEGGNSDGEAVVAASAEQLKGLKDPAEAATILISEINNEHYFDQSKGTVLISLCSKNSEQTVSADGVLNAVESYANDNGLELTVYTQSIEESKDLKQSADEAGLPVSRYVYYKKIADEKKVSLNTIKDKNIDEVTEYASEPEKSKKKEEKSEPVKTQDREETINPVTIEEETSAKKKETTSDEEKPDKKKETTSEEDKSKKKEQTTSDEEKPKPQKEETTSGEEKSGEKEGTSSGDDSHKKQEGSTSGEKSSESTSSGSSTSGSSTSDSSSSDSSTSEGE